MNVYPTPEKKMKLRCYWGVQELQDECGCKHGRPYIDDVCDSTDEMIPETKNTETKNSSNLIWKLFDTGEEILAWLFGALSFLMTSGVAIYRYCK